MEKERARAGAGRGGYLACVRKIALEEELALLGRESQTRYALEELTYACIFAARAVIHAALGGVSQLHVQVHRPHVHTPRVIREHL